MFKKIKKNFVNSPLSQKLLIIGNLGVILSVFMPWYSDLDSRNIASQFIGLSGPLYLMGYFIMASALASLAYDVSGLMGKSVKFEKAPVAQLGTGIQTLFLVFLAVSIYFHPKFGLGYVSTKTAHLGVYLAGLSSLIVCAGGALKYYYGSDSVDYYEENQALENEELEIGELIEENQVVSPGVANSVTQTPEYRIERTQVGIETRVKTVVNPYVDNKTL